MLAINDPTLKRFVLEHLVQQVDLGGLDKLLAAGFSPELLDDLRKRPLRDFVHAVQSEDVVINVSIDTQRLSACLWMCDRKRRDDMLTEYFVRNGASIVMLRTMFTMPKQELQRLRVELDMAEKATNGRPRLPPTSVRDYIHNAWHEICRQFADEPERERLWRLHQKFPAYSLSSIHRCTDEFSEQEEAAPERSQARPPKSKASA